MQEILEDFNTDRLRQVIEAVLNGRKYELCRFREPNPGEDLVFDYGGIEPNAENTVTAVLAAEKIFRLVRSPDLGDRDIVRVDAKIDGFLREHFSLYNLYFGHPVPLEQTEMPDRDEYVWFSHLHEEEQRDDLTMLAIRKK